jgi:hypothetical protein
MAGSPAGTGASPAASPGAGNGNEAAAIAQLKAIFPVLYKVLSALKVGSEAWTSVQEMIRAGGKVVGKTEEDSIVPAAIQQMATAARGGAMRNAPPVALAPAAMGGEPEKEPV